MENATRINNYLRQNGHPDEEPIAEAAGSLTRMLTPRQRKRIRHKAYAGLGRSPHRMRALLGRTPARRRRGRRR